MTSSSGHEDWWSDDIVLSPLAGALGVEVHGCSLYGPADITPAALCGLVSRYGVVIFPDQHLSPLEHLKFAGNLGTPQIHAYHASPGPYPEFLVMRSATPLADFWHADETCEQIPPDLAVLRMVETPSSGGDTSWVNQYRTYETLSPEIQSEIAPLKARHATPDGDAWADHPVLYRKPKTGRAALNVNRQFTKRILGTSEERSEQLLETLCTTADRPEVQCRYKWRAGAVAIWDNRTTLHRVAGDYTEVRHSERIAVALHSYLADL